MVIAAVSASPGLVGELPRLHGIEPSTDLVDELQRVQSRSWEINHVS
jgi:hypothetical protein